MKSEPQNLNKIIIWIPEMFVQGLKQSIRWYKSWEEIKKEAILYTIIGR